MSYDNNMTGALFPNDKGDNPKRPDMRGPVEIEGVKYWISAWTRTGDKGKMAGKRYLSLKVQKDEQHPPPRQEQAAQAGDDESNLPF